MKHECSAILQSIFQQPLSTGVVPQDWKVGKIIPVPPKKGIFSSPSSYRPVSLTCICCKLMEHIIHSHVANFLLSVDYFHSNQHGFQKGLSCERQLALFIIDISSAIDVNVPVNALFWDFEKAFSKAMRKRLFLRLSRLNLHPFVVLQ